MPQDDVPDPLTPQLERLPGWALLALKLLGLIVAALATATITRIATALSPDIAHWLHGAWLAYLQLPLGLQIGIGLIAFTLIVLLLVLIPVGRVAQAIAASRARRAEIREEVKKVVDPPFKDVQKQLDENAKQLDENASGIQLLLMIQEEYRSRSNAIRETMEVASGAEVASERYVPPDDRTLLEVPTSFIPLDEPLSAISATLDSASAFRGAWVYGPSGIGKTSSVASVIRDVPNDRFPDGMAYIDCREIRDEEAALRKVIQRFDANRVTPPARADSLPVALAALLGDKTALIVLDNVPEEEYYLSVASKLTAASAHSRVIMLSSSAPSTAGATALARVAIPYLTTDQAVNLFMLCYGIAPGQSLTEDERATVESIVEQALGNFQVAVSQAAAQAQMLGMTIQSLAEQLQQQPLEGIQDERVREVFQRSLRNLEQRHPDAARLLIAWAAFGAPTIGRRALEAMARDLNIQNPQGELTTLRTFLLAGPVEPTSLPPGSDTERWQTHRLMFEHLTQRFKALSLQDQRKAQTSALRYLAQYMAAAPESAVAIDQFAVVTSLDYALSARSPAFDEYAVLLGERIARFWRSRWDNAHSLEYLPQLMEVARRVVKRDGKSDNRLRQANLNLFYGRAIRYAGRLPEAEQYFKRDRKIRRRSETRDLKGEAAACHDLGQLYRIEGHMRAAEKYCEQALTLASLAHDRKLRGLALGELGRIARITGRTREAREHFEEAFRLLTGLGEQQDAGVMLGYLGRIARLRGQFELSAQYFEESARLAHVTHDARGEGVVQSYLGRIKRTQGQLSEAKTLFDKSLIAARAAGDTATEATVLGYQGRLLYTAGDLEQARKLFMQSLHLSRSTWDGQNVAMVLGYLGRIRRAQGHGIRALGWRVLGLIKVYQVGDSRGQALSFRQIGRFALQWRLLWLASLFANQAEAKLALLEDSKSVATVELLQAEIAIARGDFVTARQQLDQCQSTFERLEFRVDLCSCLYWRARMADAERDVAAANDFFQQALDVANAMGEGDAVSLARIKYYWGVSKTRRPETRAEGKVDKRSAKAMYRAMGARRLPEPVGRPRRRLTSKAE